MWTNDDAPHHHGVPPHGGYKPPFQLMWSATLNEWELLMWPATQEIEWGMNFIQGSHSFHLLPLSILFSLSSFLTESFKQGEEECVKVQRKG